jgi:hypothetical protein
MIYCLGGYYESPNLQRERPDPINLGFGRSGVFEEFISFSVDNLHSVDNYRIFALEVQRFSDQSAPNGLKSPILSPFIVYAGQFFGWFGANSDHFITRNAIPRGGVS